MLGAASPSTDRVLDPLEHDEAVAPAIWPLAAADNWASVRFTSSVSNLDWRSVNR